MDELLLLLLLLWSKYVQILFSYQIISARFNFFICLASEGFFLKSSNSVIVADLQRENNALLERAAEKEAALKHQRNKNR